MRLWSVAVLVGVSVSCWISWCVGLLEMGAMDVVSLGCELGWVVVGCALGGVSFVMVLVVSSLMIFSMWVSSSPVRVYRRHSRDIV
jgi:hypothetical protein